MLRGKRGYTLVETLVAMAIVGLLVALLLPAIQSARESARRAQCKSQLKQLGLGLHHYHDALRSFPPGLCSTSQMFWSGFLLPYVEQQTLVDSLDAGQPWHSGPNAEACATYLPVFRCPSSVAPRHLTAQGISERVPCDYVACSSGTATRESGPPPLAGTADSDGIFYVDSGIRMADIVDGASSTIALGETMFIYRAFGPDHTGYQQFLDHWYIGTLEGLTNEISEGMGSTGVAINSHKLDVFVDEKELAIGSHHPGGALVAFADGAVRLVAESVDRAAWSALGTRHGREVVGSY
jgi:prepilin-type N-terminal cleavage/methylation domain-containing protein